MSLEDNFHLVPAAIETLGAWEEEEKIVDTIRNKLKQVTGENKSKSYLIQRSSVAIQKGNAASILGTIRLEG